jgi:hypothetical protein
MALVNGWWIGILGLGLLPLACGSDDDEQPAGTDHTSAGAPATPVSYPPALGPEDCASTVTDLKLSQPAGADVWGGLTLLEFQVAGAGSRNFEIEAFDPDTGAWLNQYVGYAYSGQRTDGTYLLGVNLYPTEASQDADQRVRVRPTQQGCPEADWVESDAFKLVSPFEGTSWAGTIPGNHFTGEMHIVGSYLNEDVRLHLGDTAVSANFADDGTFSQTFTAPLQTSKGAPFQGCTLSLTFEGTWRYELGGFGNGQQLQIADVTLTSTKGSKCTYPALADMDINQEGFKLELGDGTYYPRIDYVPTLAIKPGAPAWSTEIFNGIVQQLGQLLGHTVPSQMDDGGAGAAGPVGDSGNAQGQFNATDVSLEKQSQ